MMLTLAPKETRPTEEQAFTAIKWASNTTERCYWIMIRTVLMAARISCILRD